MNRTTTVVVVLIAAAGLSTMVYAVPEQPALAWGGCGFGKEAKPAPAETRTLVSITILYLVL